MSFTMDFKENVVVFEPKSDKVLKIENRVLELKNVTNILVRIGFLENAFAIHDWIINNVQSNTEESIIEISENDLLVLQNVCGEIKEDFRKAEQLMPSSDGYDFRYLCNVYDMFDILEPLNLSVDGGRWFIYQGSN